MASQPISWHQPLLERYIGLRKAKRMPHAVLLSSADGTGADVAVNELARAHLCDSPSVLSIGRACGECKACSLNEAGTHPDLLAIEPEGKSMTIKVDQVRAINTFSANTPQIAGSQVCIIHGADRMNQNASNALLKVLEEPTGNMMLVLETSVPELLLPTIRSRCQLQRLEVPDEDQTAHFLKLLGFKPVSYTHLTLPTTSRV